MVFGILADGVLVLHLAFVLFVALGAVAVARWPKLAWLHLPTTAWGVWIECSHGICPLTPLESTLRQLAGGEAYEGGFVAHYLGALIYPPGLTPEDQIALGALVVGLNLAGYATLLYYRRRRRAKR